MPCTVYASVIDQIQQQALSAALVDAGIPRAAIKVVEPATDPEHRPSQVQAGSISWGLLGAVAGAAVGGFVMSWWSTPLIGAMWGAVLGGICGGYPLQSEIGEPVAEAPAMDATQIQIDAQDHAQAERARRVCAEQHAWSIMVVGAA